MVVCQYLVDKYQPNNLRLSIDEPEYGAYLNWLHHADATLTFPQTVALRYGLLEPGRAVAAGEDYAKWYLARLRHLDHTLADGREFLVGKKFTIADICVAYALFLGRTVLFEGVPLANSYQPQTAAYLDRMMARPAFQAALLTQENSVGLIDKAYSKLILSVMQLRKRLFY